MVKGISVANLVMANLAGDKLSLEARSVYTPKAFRIDLEAIIRMIESTL